MEAIIFFMFIIGIVMIITITIAMSKVKYRVNLLQKEVHDLSVRLEESLRSNKTADSEEKELPVVDISEQVNVKTIALKQTKNLKEFKNISGKTLKNIQAKNTNRGQEKVIYVSNETSTVKEPIKKVLNQVQTVNKPKSNLFTIESIISKLGIILLLIGVGFIYKLAYDKGYITPSLVIFFGYLFGLAVLGIGLRVLKKKREVLSQVLFGGGIAILYITTFSAYQGYGLMDGILAFVVLFAITFLAFFIALSVDSMAMSIIALLGGLLTPFMVGIEVVGLYGMGLYILFIGIGSMAIYIFKRWRPLQITAIVGVNTITMLLSLSGDFTLQETFEFSLLLIALLIVFYGVEYMHYYLGRDYKKEFYLSIAIISVLPVLTLFQTLMVLDLSQNVWAVVFAIVTLIFFVLNYSLYKKREHSLITDILMGYVGMFALVGVVLYFGGEVRYIAILILSVIFMIIHSKSKYLLTRIISLIIYLIGFGWAMQSLAEQIFEDDLEPIIIIVRLIVMILITFIAMMQKGVIRKVLGGLAFQVYFFVAIMSMVLIWTEDIIEPVVVIMATFGLLMVLFIVLNKKFKLLSIHAVIAMSIVPFIIKLISSGFVAYENRVDWIQTLAYIAYGIEMYILSLTILKEDAKSLIFILKCTGYGMLSSIALVEFSVWSNHFGYGLALFVCIIVGIDYFEDEDDKMMAILRHIFKIGFMATFIIYTLSGIGFKDFNILYFVFDLAMIAAFYYFLEDYLKEDRILYILVSLLYMLVIYQNLHMGENGTVTLFWAAYSIISLGYFLFKSRRSLVYIALGMIVFVAAKFIFVDLSTIETVWKIITSMAFGAALLALSYIIQPLLDKYGRIGVSRSSEKNSSEKEI